MGKCYVGKAMPAGSQATLKEKLTVAADWSSAFILSVCQQLVMLGAAESFPPNFMSLTKNCHFLMGNRACFLPVTRAKGLF